MLVYEKVENLPNAKPTIGFGRLFGMFTMDTARLFSLKFFSNSSVLRFFENVSNDDNNLNT